MVKTWCTFIVKMTVETKWNFCDIFLDKIFCINM